MSISALKGKRTLQLIIGVLISISVLSIISQILAVGPFKLLSQIIRLALNIGLCFYMYKGHRWARAIIIILSLLTVLYSGYALILLYTMTSRALLMLPFMVAYGAIAYLLIFSKSIKAYFEHIKPKGEPVLSSPHEDAQTSEEFE